MDAAATRPRRASTQEAAAAAAAAASPTVRLDWVVLLQLMALEFRGSSLTLRHRGFAVARIVGAGLVCGLAGWHVCAACVACATPDVRTACRRRRKRATGRGCGAACCRGARATQACRLLPCPEP